MKEYVTKSPNNYTYKRCILHELGHAGHLLISNLGYRVEGLTPFTLLGRSSLDID